jgi:hypothetical protein
LYQRFGLGGLSDVEPERGGAAAESPDLFYGGVGLRLIFVEADGYMTSGTSQGDGNIASNTAGGTGYKGDSIGQITHSSILSFTMRGTLRCECEEQVSGFAGFEAGVARCYEDHAVRYGGSG